jgi:hypothetical protein
MCRLFRNPEALTSRTPQGHVGLFRGYFTFFLLRKVGLWRPVNSEREVCQWSWAIKWLVVHVARSKTSAHHLGVNAEEFRVFVLMEIVIKGILLFFSSCWYSESFPQAQVHATKQQAFVWVLSVCTFIPCLGFSFSFILFSSSYFIRCLTIRGTASSPISEYKLCKHKWYSEVTSLLYYLCGCLWPQVTYWIIAPVTTTISPVRLWKVSQNLGFCTLEC